MPRFRILSNVRLTNHFPLELELIYFEFKKSTIIEALWNVKRLLSLTTQVDALIILNPGIYEELVAFINKCVLRRKTITIFYDIILSRPDSLQEKIIGKIKSLLFSGVDKFFVVHKDTTGYERYYKIPKSKFMYIPFKANNYDVVDKYRCTDKGYVLVCGISQRDYETFIRAIEITNIPAKIVLPDRKMAKFHKTPSYEGRLPASIDMVTGKVDDHLWNQYIAEARIVVVPILERAIQAAGISVYLEAMALGKPVIVTEGVSTHGILSNEAEIVPPGDSVALATCLKKLWEDKIYRDQLAYRGKTYALSLGNTTRLVKDILKNTMAC